VRERPNLGWAGGVYLTGVVLELTKSHRGTERQSDGEGNAEWIRCLAVNGQRILTYDQPSAELTAFLWRFSITCLRFGAWAE